MLLWEHENTRCWVRLSWSGYRVVPNAGSSGLGREALATLVAAGREDCAAGAGAHAQAEAVLLAAAAVIRLESPLGHVEHSETSVRASPAVPEGLCLRDVTGWMRCITFTTVL